MSSSDEFDAEEYVVEGILDHSSKNLFHVRWKGFGEEEDTWEPLQNVADCGQFAAYLRAIDPAQRKRIKAAVKELKQRQVPVASSSKKKKSKSRGKQPKLVDIFSNTSTIKPDTPQQYFETPQTAIVVENPKRTPRRTTKNSPVPSTSRKTTSVELSIDLPIVQRGRSTKRKSAPSSESVTTNKISTSPVDTTVKRGRGRPPKTTQKSKVKTKNPSTAPRLRGRPPKISRISNSPNQTAIAANPSLTPTKRGRGRPRKNPELVVADPRPSQPLDLPVPSPNRGDTSDESSNSSLLEQSPNPLDSVFAVAAPPITAFSVSTSPHHISGSEESSDSDIALLQGSVAGKSPRFSFGDQDSFAPSVERCFETSSDISSDDQMEEDVFKAVEASGVDDPLVSSDSDDQEFLNVVQAAYSYSDVTRLEKQRKQHIDQEANERSAQAEKEQKEREENERKERQEKERREQQEREENEKKEKQQREERLRKEQEQREQRLRKEQEQREREELKERKEREEQLRKEQEQLEQREREHKEKQEREQREREEQRKLEEKIRAERLEAQRKEQERKEREQQLAKEMEEKQRIERARKEIEERRRKEKEIREKKEQERKDKRERERKEMEERKLRKEREEAALLEAKKRQEAEIEAKKREEAKKLQGIPSHTLQTSPNTEVVEASGSIGSPDLFAEEGLSINEIRAALFEENPASTSNGQLPSDHTSSIDSEEILNQQRLEALENSLGTNPETSQDVSESATAASIEEDDLVALQTKLVSLIQELTPQAAQQFIDIIYLSKKLQAGDVIRSPTTETSAPTRNQGSQSNRSSQGQRGGKRRKPFQSQNQPQKRRRF